MSRPTGPAPVTRTRSSGRTPASSTAWRAMAVGSARAAARVVSESGMRRVLPADTVTYWAKAPRMSRMSDGPRLQADRGPAPAARSARPAPRRRVEDHPLAARTIPVRRPRSKPRSPTTRDRGWRRAGRSSRRPDGGRTRRSRTPPPRPAAPPAAGSGMGTSLDGDPAIPHTDRRGHQLRWHGGHATAPSPTPALRPDPSRPLPRLTG